jgi:hypothetical protein
VAPDRFAGPLATAGAQSLMPEFFIHCGLHKTGTTALQQFMALNAQALLDSGLHYPAGGTGSTKAHHNLAWQLARDRRFFGRFGNIELMLRQAAAIAKDTVISSEDFESSLRSPERWTSLVEALRGQGFAVTFVIYLRDPASYLQSLFLENVKHGCGDEFGTVARAALERGVYGFNDWMFQFDYDLIARQMAQVSGAQVVFRSFEHLADGAIVPDFFSVIGSQIPDALSVADQKVNAQASTAQLLVDFLRNRHMAFMPPMEQLAEVLGLMVGGRPAFVRMPDRLAEVVERQRASKVKKSIEPQTPVTVAPRGPRPGDWEVNISRLFSWETQVEALALYEQAPGSGTEKIDALRSGDQGVFESWRNWVAAGL